MNRSILITAGGTSEPVDAVRVITNRSTGKTGVELANLAHRMGWKVELLLARGLYCETKFPFVVNRFETVEELGELLERGIRVGKPTGVVHAAAVSDYVLDHVESNEKNPPGTNSPKTGKISGHLESLRLVLKRAPRLLAKIRSEWHYEGILVSFKLETDPENLLLHARRSLQDNGSNMVVANTWENHRDSALLVFGPDPNGQTPLFIHIPRETLQIKILDFIEQQFLASSLQKKNFQD